MKLLIANHNLLSWGGTETWTLTLAEEFKRLGHEVCLYAPTGNSIAPEFPSSSDSYDLALINHNTNLESLKDLPCKKIFTSHGVIPSLEQPTHGADVYVSVSEEVQDNLKAQGYESVIIRNPIDTKRFYPTRKVHKKLENVLFMSNYQGKAREVIKTACEGLNLRIWGQSNQTSDAVTEMNWADLVIGLGRTAYEAMSLNRNVIIYDYNGADGFATEELLLEARKNNCSGRRFKKDLDANDLKNLFANYNPHLQLRDYILQNNNVTNIAQAYLSL